jgi:hypothetical protein
LPTPLVWIEHWPKETTDVEEETFDLVVFSSYEVAERAPYHGRRRHGWESRPGKLWTVRQWRCWWVERCR